MERGGRLEEEERAPAVGEELRAAKSTQLSVGLEAARLNLKTEWAPFVTKVNCVVCILRAHCAISPADLCKPICCRGAKLNLALLSALLSMRRAVLPALLPLAFSGANLRPSPPAACPCSARPLMRCRVVALLWHISAPRDLLHPWPKTSQRLLCARYGLQLETDATSTRKFVAIELTLHSAASHVIRSPLATGKRSQRPPSDFRRNSRGGATSPSPLLPSQ